MQQLDKKYIEKTPPDKAIFYNGYKTGKVMLTWRFESGKEIKYVAEGDIMSFSSSFRSVNIFDVKVSSSFQNQ